MHLTKGPNDRVLGAAVGISILLHGVLLSVHFKFPDPLKWKSAEQPLEVVPAERVGPGLRCRGNVLAWSSRRRRAEGQGGAYDCDSDEHPGAPQRGRRGGAARLCTESRGPRAARRRQPLPTPGARRRMTRAHPVLRSG